MSFINQDHDQEPASEFADIICELYSKFPKNMGENKIIPIVENQEDLEDGILIFIFEMLFEFYLEGILHHDKLEIILNNINNNNINNINNNSEMFQMLIKNKIYDDINYKNIDMAFLSIPEKWIKSIGFILRIDEELYNDYLENMRDEEFKKIYHMNNNYCKVILKLNPADKPYFEYKNISSDYYCFVNSNFNKDQIKNINNMFALLVINNKIYKISFLDINASKIDQNII